MESEQWLEDKFRCLLVQKWDQYLYGRSFQYNILIRRESRVCGENCQEEGVYFTRDSSEMSAVV